MTILEAILKNLRSAIRNGIGLNAVNLREISRSYRHPGESGGQEVVNIPGFRLSPSGMESPPGRNPE